ncbi:MAG: nitronate monooxygenase [Sedimentisphaerales bacterium]|nr:nitronate monooxygenase [Sedimentisphaerales bacterium]
MRLENIPVLRIGNLEICPPIIQGGMGIRVSGGNLAAAAANTGCAGIIASAGLGQFENSELEGAKREVLVKLNEEALRAEIRKARSLSDGVIGVNIMVALTDYENHVKTSIEEGVDLIISGAGLALALPKYLDGSDVKLVPIVSSARALKILCKRWVSHFNKLPDAVVVEGVKAGGHLGYTYESIYDNTAPRVEDTVREVIAVANSYRPNIPVIAAGGIFDGNDIVYFLKLGVSGVQMATRFVCTDECDVHDNFKQAYLDAREGDITVIKSPVGLPGRVINNEFVERIKQGKTMPFKCNYQCLITCEPQKAPYCIAKVLANAAQGKMDEAFAFAGSNAYRCTEIVPVKTLVESLVKELSAALAQEPLRAG